MHEKSYKPYLDGLRGLSILLVVIAHGGLGHIVPGGLGVTIFFFISGYLITALLLAEQEKTQQIGLKNFYMRRLWRLFPAMSIYIVMSIFVIYSLNKSINWWEPVSGIFYLSNYYIIFKGFDYIHNNYSPFSILWSLAIEEHFYLFFAPLLAFLKNKKIVLASIIILLIAPLFIRWAVTISSAPDFSDEYTYRATDARIDSIAYGCLLAVMEGRRFSKINPKYNLGLIFGIVGILFSLLYRDNHFRQVYRYSIQGVCIYFLLRDLIYFEKIKFLRNFFENKILVFVGKLSYSMYLYHWLALILTIFFIGKIELKPAWQAAYWTSLLVFSGFSYYMIERPTLKLRIKYGSNAT